MIYYEKQITKQVVFEGRIVNIRSDVAEIINGKRVFREVVEHPGGVAIVPLTDDGNVLMVRQYRYPVEEELLEIPAGKLERGEDPLECAVRELSEETGCEAGELVFLGATYPSPGFCEEILYIYLAKNLVYGEAHPDEDEFLSVEAVHIDALIDMIMDNSLPDGKSIVGIMKAKKYLERESGEGRR